MAQYEIVQMSGDWTPLHSARVSEPYRYGVTPLHLAIQSGWFASVVKTSPLALDLAVCSGNQEIVKMLIQAGKKTSLDLCRSRSKSDIEEIMCVHP
jgi:hypothetical protein